MGQRYPLPITTTMLAKANVNEGKPRYNTPADWIGGVKGDDVNTATAAVAVANRDGDIAEVDYGPRTQAAKATAMGTTIVTDISRARGAVAPNQRYPQVGDTAPAAPVVSSISPNTAAAGAQPLVVTITGTGFTAWSSVFTGAQTIPEQYRYVSPTTLMIMIDPRSSVAGTASVAVSDHGVMSNVDKLFTFT